jgi:hypothetical protein
MKTRDEQLKLLEKLKKDLQVHRKGDCRCKTSFVCDGEVAAILQEIRLVTGWLNRYT